MQVNFGGTLEEVVTREEFPLDKARGVLEGKTIAILGYGPQGRGQSLNLNDNSNGKYKVILGLEEHYSKPGDKKKTSWEQALDERVDGKPVWVKGVNLFSIEDAAEQGDIIGNLISDAGQVKTWKQILPHLTEGKTMYVSHGMPTHFHETTGIVPPKNIDVVLVAPKGPGGRVRTNFTEGSGINSSYAVKQNYTGNAENTVKAIGMLIGSGFMFPTTDAKEVISDHFGERANLLPIPTALAMAEYSNLRAKGLGSIDAFIQSSEQLTQVILPLIGKYGVDEIYRQAREAGELGTVKVYQDATRKALKPIMDVLYQSVVDGVEAATSIRENSKPNYRNRLETELRVLDSTEIWQTGTLMREAASKLKADRVYGQKITNWRLAGAVIGAIEAQAEKLHMEGHSPSEWINETVEELTQSLNLNYQKDGPAGLIGYCSTTAQRGALDWLPHYYTAFAQIFTENDLRYDNEDHFDPAPHHTGIPNSKMPNIWDVWFANMNLRPENVKLVTATSK